MKSVLLSAVVLLSATASFAQYTSKSNYDDYFVDTLAWCEGNKVMSEKSDGTSQVYRDCEAVGQVCQALSLEQMNRTIFTATCK